MISNYFGPIIAFIKLDFFKQLVNKHFFQKHTKTPERRLEFHTMPYQTSMMGMFAKIGIEIKINMWKSTMTIDVWDHSFNA